MDLPHLEPDPIMDLPPLVPDRDPMMDLDLPRLDFRADERLMVMRRSLMHLNLMDFHPEFDDDIAIEDRVPAVAAPVVAGPVPLVFGAGIGNAVAIPAAMVRDAAANDDDDAEEQPEDEKNVVGLAPASERKVFSIRNNDPDTNHLYLGSGLDPRAWKQLGRFMAKNTHVFYLCLLHCHLKGQSMVDLCAGLRHNQSIREFEIGDNKLKKAEMESLSPFISNNPVLHTLNIEGCLGKCGVDLLSSALMCRVNSIENMSLDGNCLGSGHREPKGNFDTFVTALEKNSRLRRLSLMGNAIGEMECKALGKLLKNPETKLKSLILRHNIIDNKCAAILAESLTNNTQLSNIDLDRNERVQAKGLMAFLHLISSTPSSTIHLEVRWPHPTEDGKVGTVLSIKLNEPLHNLAIQLRSKGDFPWASDMTKVKFLSDRTRLDLNETPFFYSMHDGDAIDVAEEESYVRFMQKVPEDMTEVRKSGVHETFNSNHTLSSLGYETALRRSFDHGSLLREFLEANKRENKCSASRIKIFRYHVAGPYKGCRPLSLDDICEIDAVIQPRVLAWVGRALRDDDNDRTFLSKPVPDVVRLHATYEILRAMPMLCGF